MKTILCLLLLSGSTYGQVVVYDPATHATDIANQFQNLAQYIAMVNNQVTQINTMTQQLQQTTAYVQAFGNPAALLNIVGADQLIQSVNQSGVGQTIGELRELASGVEALQYNANGLYQSVGETFRIYNNIEVPRVEVLYRKFAAVDRAAMNFQAVYDDVATRRWQLKIQIGNTTRQLQAATTDAEIQKLGGILLGQGAQLEAIDREVEFAASQVVIQDIENRNDEERQIQAFEEKRQAEFNQAIKDTTMEWGIEGFTLPE